MTPPLVMVLMSSSRVAEKNRSRSPFTRLRGDPNAGDFLIPFHQNDFKRSLATLPQVDSANAKTQPNAIKLLGQLSLVPGVSVIEHITRSYHTNEIGRKSKVTKKHPKTRAVSVLRTLPQSSPD